MTEDEMAGWYHRLVGHEFEQAPRDGDGQGLRAHKGKLPRKGRTHLGKDLLRSFCRHSMLAQSMAESGGSFWFSHPSTRLRGSP